MKYSYAIWSALASSISAHTWIEQLMVVAANGTLVGQPGFPRGNVKRSDPGFGDPAMVNLIPGNGRTINQILPTDLMCKSTQTTQTQTDDSPRLQASAGDNVALRYQENGHVSLPQNQPGKPDNRGTIFVYGTTDPKEDDAFLSIHRVWNAAGTGGDGRGVLLSTQNYDDGQCYQVNGGLISQTRQKTFSHVANPLMGADLWCQQDIQIPTTAPSGKPYTLYWVWDWPTLPGTAGFPDGKQEIYTTCMDVDIIDGSGNQAGSGSNSQNKAAAVNFIKGQDVANAGVPAQLAEVANPTAVSGQFIPFSAVSGQPSQTDDSGFTSYLTETVTGAATTSTIPPAAQPSANTDSPFSRTRHSRPSVVPVGSPSSNPNGNNNNNNGQPNFGPGNNNNPNNPTFYPRPSNNNNPAAPSAANTNQPASPPTNTDQPSIFHIPANTATAISAPSPSSPPSAAATASTVTVQPLAAPAASTVTAYASVFQTVTQTRMETVFFSASRRDVDGALASSATVTEAPVVTGIVGGKSGNGERCSKTEAVYRLRARMPFYILPGAGEGEKGGC